MIAETIIIGLTTYFFFGKQISARESRMRSKGYQLIVE